MTSLKNVFARVENNRILEYPVTKEIIQNRKAPLSMFRQVKFLEKPKTTEFELLTESIELVSGIPTVSYKVRNLTVQEILDNLYGTKPELTIDQVPLEVFKRVSFLAREKIGQMLDAFAKTRGYDNIASLASYSNDPDPQQAAEGLLGTQLRSRCWVAIKDYEVGVMSGTIPVPRYESQILKVLPEFTWGDI